MPLDFRLSSTINLCQARQISFLLMSAWWCLLMAISGTDGVSQDGATGLLHSGGKKFRRIVFAISGIFGDCGVLAGPF
jgi:hypothetical protein